MLLGECEMEAIVLVAIWFGISLIVHACYPLARRMVGCGLKFKLIFALYVVMWPLYLLDMAACIVFKRGNIH
jgi:hypothetical protein